MPFLLTLKLVDGENSLKVLSANRNDLPKRGGLFLLGLSVGRSSSVRRVEEAGFTLEWDEGLFSFVFPMTCIVDEIL